MLFVGLPILAVALFPVLHAGLPLGDDQARYLTRLSLFHDQQANGVLYPRWFPYRLLSIIASIQMLCAAGWSRYLERLDPRRPNTEVVLAAGSAHALANNRPWHLHYQVEAPAPTRATLGQFYFPGWEVAINGTPIDDDVLVAALNPNGQLQVDVPAGLSELDASYRGPPGGRSLALVSLLLLVAALGACRVRPLAQQS